MNRMTLGIIAVTVTAAAQAPAEQPQTTQSGLNNDPNETVCVNERQIGSRVASRRVCRTRAEWTALREQQRQVVDRVQMNKATTCPPIC